MEMKKKNRKKEQIWVTARTKKRDLERHTNWKEHREKRSRKRKESRRELQSSERTRTNRKEHREKRSRKKKLK